MKILIKLVSAGNMKYLSFQDTQTQTVEDLTGVYGYVESSGEVFMSRGHFSPNGDFVYYSHQVKMLAWNQMTKTTHQFSFHLGCHFLLHQCGPSMAVLQWRQLEYDGAER